MVQLLKHLLIKAHIRAELELAQKDALSGVTWFLVALDASKVQWMDLKLKQSRASWKQLWIWLLWCELSPPPPPFDRISIMLTAMLQLCSWFRWWNISRARWLLCAFISWVVFFAPQLLRRRSIKPTFSGRDRTSIHYSSLTHTHVNTHCNNPHGHINKCWIACLISSG